MVFGAKLNILKRGKVIKVFFSLINWTGISPQIQRLDYPLSLIGSVGLMPGQELRFHKLWGVAKKMKKVNKLKSSYVKNVQKF